MRILALDQGTTSTRGLLVDARGGCRIVTALRHTQHFPAADRVEHDPAELLANLRAVIDAAGPVDAIALSNQGESCLAWDAQTGAPLSRIIVWQDRRTEARLAKMAEAEAMVRARAGLPLDPYFSASKLAWLLETQPQVAEAHRTGRLRLGTTDAFFLQNLTGAALTDVTTASRTSLMSLETGSWDQDLCALFGVPLECLPVIRATVSDFGRIGETPVTAAIVDQQAALYGHGCRAPGDAKITFGTGAFALALAGETRPDLEGSGLLPTVAWRLGERTRYASDGGVHAAGAAVEWALRVGLLDGPEALAAFDAVPAIDRDLAFVPALSGLAAPHWDGSAAGLFIGMTGATTRDDLAQALIEGVALRAAEVVERMGQTQGAIERISVDGGLSRSEYLCQFLADVTGAQIVLPGTEELTAYGAAQLAALGLGVKLPAPLPRAEITPRACDRAARMSRFSDAVTRARGWRQ
ncbi:FGGY family carbohydrate kinase [Salipiger sp. PrR002]|uniref:FGGY family carbohydrate kinase n=1 Tax=Salipiger sp. PrR002 TaxID=2706489 RepID=UPI0013BAC9E9|nr:FGGY family carbohydrate kinase [Salipiger sp. PrR002]NDW01548.1 glycerol kinase [Salipiger sp. PrR002]NDW58217.1 glycerol kinase [Salipiger sp. PrR004]